MGGGGLGRARGTTAIGWDWSLHPTLLRARTLKKYITPFFKPVMVARRLFVINVLHCLLSVFKYSTLYPVIGCPPSLLGASHVKNITLSPGKLLMFRGGVGTVGAGGGGGGPGGGGGGLGGRGTGGAGGTGGGFTMIIGTQRIGGVGGLT